ncbi:MAG: hypothetical protein ACPIOQ_47695, partial [Promethearchaeia archaeon]
MLSAKLIATHSCLMSRGRKEDATPIGRSRTNPVLRQSESHKLIPDSVGWIGQLQSFGSNRNLRSFK